MQQRSSILHRLFASRPALLALSGALAILLLVLGFTAQAADSGRTTALPKTSGVNYEFADTDAHPDYLSSSDLKFQMSATVGPDRLPVTLESVSFSTCSGPCNAQVHDHRGTAGSGEPGHGYLNCDISGGSAECALRVHRFAQHGRSEKIGLEWLVVMVDEEELLQGRMKTEVRKDGSLRYPAPAELGGHMIVTVRMKGGEPIRLRSREEPIFKGAITGWPPYGSVFELSNGPIEYYREDEIDKRDAEPYMVVRTNRVQLGEKPAPFFAVKPEITSVTRRRGTNRIEWTPSAEKLDGMNIGRYFVYRSDTPDDLASWKRIAELPVRQTTYDDRDGTARSSYLVSHAEELPFGYWYEGIFDEIVAVGGKASAK